MKTTREQLYKEIWAEAITKVAIRYGVSDNGIRKKCKVYNIPTPNNKYWGQLHAGHNPKPMPLPDYTGDENIIFQNTYKPNNPKQKEVSNSQMMPELTPRQDKDRILKVYSSLNVNIQLKNPHPLIIKHQEVIKKAKQEKRLYHELIDIRGFHFYGDDKIINTHSVSEKSLPRLYLFLDALFKAVEDISGKVIVQERYKSIFLLEGCEIEFNNKEKYNQVILPINERKDKYDSGQRHTPSGLLTFIISVKNVKSGGYYPYRWEWKETAKKKLSDMIQEVFSKICEMPYYVEQRRSEYMIELQKQHEEDERRRQNKKRHDNELAQVKDLIQKAELWYLSKKLENFLDSIEIVQLNDEGLDKWINWAREKVKWLDPLNNFEDEILTEDDKSELIETQEKPNKNIYGYWR